MSDPDPATAANLEAIDAAAGAWDHLDSFAFGSKPRERLARLALEAARPLIEAEARKAERQRIRQVIDKHEAECICDSHALCSRLHADLLDGDGDA